MRNAFYRKICLYFGKRLFLTQNELKHSFQQRVVFLSRFDAKRIFLARYPSNLEKKTILTQTEVKHSF